MSDLADEGLAAEVAQASSKRRRAIQTSISMDVEHDALLTALADAVCDGNRSKAVVHLIDVHAGHEILKARERETPTDEAPFEVVRWKKPRLTRELIAYVAGLVRAGNRPEAACDLAGITPRQNSYWSKKGRTDRAEGHESLEADFVTALGQAAAECEVEDIQRLRELGFTNYRALTWRLERQYPDVYGERKRIDKAVQHSTWPAMDFDKLTAVEVQELIRIVRKASADDDGLPRGARPAAELLPVDVIEGEGVEIAEAL